MPTNNYFVPNNMLNQTLFRLEENGWNVKHIFNSITDLAIKIAKKGTLDMVLVYHKQLDEYSLSFMDDKHTVIAINRWNIQTYLLSC